MLILDIHVIQSLRNERKKYHVMKFNASLNIDFSKWTQVTICLQRRNILVVKVVFLSTIPKVGAELITNLIGKDGEGKQPEDLKPAATGWIQEKEICSS